METEHAARCDIDTMRCDDGCCVGLQCPNVIQGRGNLRICKSDKIKFAPWLGSISTCSMIIAVMTFGIRAYQLSGSSNGYKGDCGNIESYYVKNKAACFLVIVEVRRTIYMKNIRFINDTEHK